MGVDIVYVGFYCVYVLVGGVELFVGNCIGVVFGDVIGVDVDDLVCGWIIGIVVVVY